ncbi:TonB-dependent receptor [Sphingomonas quercus]|uniref:TonB-dependent receptor n=1 Tax=Sphingomonas quercus TaxID=2842451 RepID=A0ABS6BH70_9SPHN|nr:TonB-dependent receptor [Sphingomonas quercus]MBU3077648.1 TonB-dependent receptor [Sphingomonas quercus]
MNRMIRCGLLLAASCWPALALAQAGAAAGTGDSPAAAKDGTIGEIVVTAQKRAENVQDIPLAITAVGGDTLRERQVNGVDQLVAVTPSINFGTYGGAARIAIRGIGFDLPDPGSEGRIAYHLDGVYVSRPSAQLGTFFDVDRVEVLRGPQGTLYGRNATGGSINVISKAPTEALSGYANLTVGNYGRVAVESAVSGSLSDDVTARLAVMSNNRGGYGKNEYTGNDIDDANQRGARASVRIKPADNLTTDLSADFYRENDHAYGIHYFGQYSPDIQLRAGVLGGTAPSKLRNLNSDFDPTNRRELYGFAGAVTWDLGPVTLKSISAYRHSQFRDVTDIDMTELPLSQFIFAEKAHQYSQELQLSGSFGNSNWLIGGYYFDEKVVGSAQVPSNLILNGGPDRYVNGFKVEGHLGTKATAVFGQLDLALSDAFKVILGARYNHETHSITDVFQLDNDRDYAPNAPLLPFPGFPRSDAVTDNVVTPKAGLEFKLNDDALLYATVSRGFKSGGYNLGLNVPAFKPENIWAYEAGLKLTTADRRLRANLAGFYYDYSNLQLAKVVNNNVVTENAGAAIIYGGEAEVTFLPFTGFQLDGALSVMHSEYRDFSSVDPADPNLGLQDLEGHRLVQAPDVTLTAGAQYGFAGPGGEIRIRGELNYRSRVYFTAFNIDSVGQARNTKFNAFLTWTSDDGHVSATIFGRNLTNKITKTGGLVNTVDFGSPISGSISPPRTFGFTLGYTI